MCDFSSRNDIKHLIYKFFYHIYVSMYLFYVVDGLDIKKMEKNEEKKMNIFVPNDFFPIISDYFPIITIFSSRRYYPNND